MIEVTFEFYGQARQLMQSSHWTLRSQRGIKVNEAVQNLIQRFPCLEQLAGISRWAIGVHFVPLDTQLDENETLVMIPPVSGG